MAGFLLIVVFQICWAYFCNGFYLPGTNVVYRYDLNVSTSCPGPKWPEYTLLLDLEEHHTLVVDDNGALGAFGASGDKDGGEVECHWSTSRSSPADGIVAVIQEKHLNGENGDACHDYIRFHNYDPLKKKSNSTRLALQATRSPDYHLEVTVCPSDQLYQLSLGEKGLQDILDRIPPPGPFDPIVRPLVTSDEMHGMMGHHWGPFLRNGTFVFAGEAFMTTVHIGKRRFDDPVSFRIAYTPYMKCGESARSNRYDFDCGHGLCISGSTRRDGLVNCPFEDCADEESCHPPNGHTGESTYDKFGWSIIIKLIGVILVVIFITVISYVSKKKRSNAAKRAGNSTEPLMM